VRWIEQEWQAGESGGFVSVKKNSQWQDRPGGESGRIRLFVARRRSRYQRADRSTKGRILDDACLRLGLSRKHVIRLLRASAPPRARRGRRARYGPAIGVALEWIWLDSDRMCAKRLTPALPAWIAHYVRKHGRLSRQDQTLLRSISSATVDRLLRDIRLRHPRQEATVWRQRIPVSRDRWRVQTPGVLLVEAVSHGGGAGMDGPIWTLLARDAASGWAAARAVWRPGPKNLAIQMKALVRALPFDVLGVHVDNSDCFHDKALLAYLRSGPRPMQVTRRGTFDDPHDVHLDQAVATHPRELFGYVALDRRGMVAALNELYALEWSQYVNLFCRTSKLLKIRPVQSGRRRLYDTPRSPADRLAGMAGVRRRRLGRVRVAAQRWKTADLRAAVERKVRAIIAMKSVYAEPDLPRAATDA
jgi:hypothetical protein